MSYFESFPNFEPQPKNSFRDEFNRLAQQQRWAPRSDEWHGKRREALTKEFEHHFGSEDTSLERWQSRANDAKSKIWIVYADMDFQALEKVNVNIWDVIDQARTGAEAKKFPSLRELTAFTTDTKRYYPLLNIKEGKVKGKDDVDGYLKVLLRPLLHPKHRSKK